MKPISLVLATALVLAAPIGSYAQSRDGHGWGGSRGGGAPDGGWRGGDTGGAARSSDAGSSRWGGSGRTSAPAPGTGNYGGPRDGGVRGGPYNGFGDRGRFRYPAYLGLDLGFALGFSLAYPWYGDYPWGYGYYGPAYFYGPGAPPAPYDDPFARDYGDAPPPATATARYDDSASCGRWVWNAAGARYDWDASDCRSPPP